MEMLLADLRLDQLAFPAHGDLRVAVDEARAHLVQEVDTARKMGYLHASSVPLVDLQPPKDTLNVKHVPLDSSTKLLVPASANLARQAASSRRQAKHCASPVPQARLPL
jgi:hypothetical protein